MFGLEKKRKDLFEFDLEKDLKEDASKKDKLLKTAEEKIQEIKNLLRKGTSAENFDSFGILLHGFAALQRTINRIQRKK